MALGSSEYITTMTLRTQGYAEGAQQISRVGQTAAATKSTVQQATGGIRQAGMQMYRYTFYAMAALQLAQSIIGTALLRKLIEPATEITTALDRIAALTAEATTRISEIEAVAVRVAGTVPYKVNEIVNAMENLYRAGRSVSEIMEDIEAVAKLAFISGRSLAEEADFLASVMSAFRSEGMKAADVVGMLAFAATKSMYKIADLSAAMSNAMGTAAGFGQTVDQLLTLITLFGQKGYRAQQAGTMVNQMFARIGDKDTLAVLEAAGEYLKTVEGFGRIEPLFLESGDYGDIGRNMLQLSKAFKIAGDEFVATGQGTAAEWTRMMTRVLSEVFGVRQIRPFLVLADYTAEEYDALQKAIREATGEADEYMNRMTGKWEFTRQWMSSTFHLIKGLFGATMIEMLSPLGRGVTELGDAFRKLMTDAEGSPTLFAKILSLMGLLTTAVTMVGGAVALGAGLWMLYAGRLHDVGMQLMLMPKYAHLAATGMSPVRVALTHFLGRFMGPLKIISGLAATIGILFLAWHKNLGGVRDVLKPIVDGISKMMGKPGELGGIISGKVKESPLAGMAKAFGEGFMGALDVMLRGVVIGLTLFHDVLAGMWMVLGPVVKLLGQFLDIIGVNKFIPYVVGAILAFAALRFSLMTTIKMTRSLALSMLWLARYALGGLLVMVSKVLHIFGVTFLDKITATVLGGLGRKKETVQIAATSANTQATLANTAAVTTLTGTVGTLAGTVGTQTLATTAQTTSTTGLTAFVGAQTAATATNTAATATQTVTTATNTVATGLLTKILAIKTAVAGAATGAMGWMGAQTGLIMGAGVALGAKILAVGKLLLALAAVFGVGYAIAKAISPRRESGNRAWGEDTGGRSWGDEPTSALPAIHRVTPTSGVTGLTSPVSAGNSFQVAYNPTFVLKEGTSDGQAREIMAVVRAEFPRMFDDVTRKRGHDLAELAYRAQAA